MEAAERLERQIDNFFGRFSTVTSEIFDNWREIGIAGTNAAEEIASAFNDAIDQIVEDLIRVTASEAFKALVNLIPGINVGNTESGFFSRIAEGLFGAQRGASVILGGRPGIDSNVLSDANGPLLRYSAGERLDITPANGRRGGQNAPQVNNFEINFAGNVNEADALGAVEVLREELPDIIASSTSYANVARPLRG